MLLLDLDLWLFEGGMVKLITSKHECFKKFEKMLILDLSLWFFLNRKHDQNFREDDFVLHSSVKPVVS